MQMDVITNTLAQKVIDTIYDEWHHEGHIEVEHTDDFYFTIDGKLYCVKVREVDEIEDQSIKSQFKRYGGKRK